jgi:guanyl-specific ribonuclease Sa
VHFTRYANYCSGREIWSGSPCLRQTYFLDSCISQRTALAQQAKRMRAAEVARQTACASGATEECSQATGEAQSEARLYAVLQEKLRQCEERSRIAYSNGGYTFGNYAQGLFDLQGMDPDHPW